MSVRYSMDRNLTGGRLPRPSQSGPLDNGMRAEVDIAAEYHVQDQDTPAGLHQMAPSQRSGGPAGGPGSGGNRPGQIVPRRDGISRHAVDVTVDKVDVAYAAALCRA